MSAAPRIRAGWVIGAAFVALLVVMPYLPQVTFADGKVFFFGDNFLRSIMIPVLWQGIAAASLIFLAGYGGMVSLAQTAMYGIAGFTMASLVTADDGPSLGLPPWLGVVIAIFGTVLVGIVLGAVAARSEGIYFLMLTLAFGVLVFYVYGTVPVFGGFGGINQVARPSLVGNVATDPTPLYYVAFVASAIAFIFVLYLVRTPFGMAMQGVRDDPTRMRALGYNVALHRTLAFAAGAFIASFAGILSVWSNGNAIQPTVLNLGNIIDILVIAVIGGMFKLVGAWIGAFVFVAPEIFLKNYGIERFNTIMGAVFLVIVLLSPGGLVGIWESVWSFFRRRGRREEPTEAVVMEELGM